jgi:DNA-binding response OmpR family regulator
MNNAWLVDDDEEMATAIGLMLKILKFDWQHYLDAPSAANALLDGPAPDLILLDINMPQVSGKDFLEFVRLRSDFDGLPIVMASSEFNEVQMDELFALGADGFVLKPVSIDELELAIDQAMTKKGKPRQT